MTTLTKVARFHLQVDGITIFYIAWGVLAFDFLVNLVIAAQISPSASKPYYTGALASIYVIMAVVGTVAIVRTLAFGLVLASAGAPTTRAPCCSPPPSPSSTGSG